MSAVQDKRKTGLFKWLMHHITPYRWRAVIAVLALFVAAMSWLVLGQGIRIAIDSGFVASNQASLSTAVIAIVIICVVASIATFIRFYLMTWLGERVSADIRNEVFAHLLHLPPSFYHAQRTGEVISRFTSDTTVLQSVVGMTLSMAIRSLVSFTGAILLMLYTHPVLTLTVLLAVPVVLLPLRIFAPKVRKFAKLSQDRIGDIGAHVDQTLHEIATVQAFTAEHYEIKKFNRIVDDALSTASHRIRYRALLIGVVMLTSLMSVVSIGWFGAQLVLNESLSAGQLSAFLFYALIAGTSVATFSEIVGEVQRGLGASERLFELLQTQSNLRVSHSPATLAVSHAPEIEFRDVSFRYPDSPPLFNALNLYINPGETVALVGPSGAGKTTLMQLLLRFYDVQSGGIFIDNVAIHDVSLSHLRSHIAIVAQDPAIFAASVMENIRYGHPNATDDDVKRAAKAAFAHEFIDRLDQGFDTQLGERGVKLSGGQRQRIAIARAILANRPILLLDEATSALDALSERMVQEAINNLIAGRTTLVIAHRLATVQHADRIIVLNNGSITNVGKHETLLKSDAMYRKYAELQFLV